MLLPRDTVPSGPMEARSMALWKPESEFMSVAYVVTEGHTDNQLETMLVAEGQAAAVAILIWMVCAATQDHGDI